MDQIKYPPSKPSPNEKEDEDSDEDLGWQWIDPPEDNPLVTYCDDTSLHGFNYVGQQGRHIFERLLWFTALSIVSVYGGIFIWRLYVQHRDVPIITIFKPTATRIDYIPFPAVTICNVNNIQKSKFVQVLREIEENPEREVLDRLRARLLDMYYICDGADSYTDKLYSRRGHTVDWLTEPVSEILFGSNDTNFEQFSNPRRTLAEGSQSCSEMILYCLWQGKIMENCSEIFEEVETDFGYCCTFNMIPTSLLLSRSHPRDNKDKISEWKKENISSDNLLFTEENKGRKIPLRQVHPGREAGLSVLLNPDLNEYHCTNTDSYGFVISLHSPLDFPRMKGYGMGIPNGSEVLVKIRPQITVTDETVEEFTLDHRKCYFGKEARLERYTKYTASNCVDECIARRTRDRCGCVRYYMPYATGHRKDKLCRPQDYKCVAGVRETIYREGLDRSCGKCLASCTEIEYEAKTTSLLVQNKKVERLLNQSLPETPREHGLPSIIHIYFEKDSTYARLRTERESMEDFIANAGGLLGFTMGFSILSLLEIVYYFTLRLWCSIYRDKLVRRREREIANRQKIINMMFDRSFNASLRVPPKKRRMSIAQKLNVARKSIVGIRKNSIRPMTTISENNDNDADK